MDNNGDSAADPPTLPCTGTNYALDGKIMLSTVVLLFLAIFLILGFHSYARCFFHRRLRGHRRRLHRQQLFRPTPLAPSTSVVAGGGLDASVLKSLPIFTFHYSKSDASFECAVCLSEIEEGEKGRRLSKCDHVFHVDCIDAWFESHANCPLCRATVPANKVSQAENAAGVKRATAAADGAWSIGTSDCEIGGCSTSSSSSACSSTPPPASCPKAVEIEGITVESSPAAMEDRVEELQKIGSTGRDRSKSPGDRILGLKRILSI